MFGCQYWGNIVPLHNKTHSRGVWGGAKPFISTSTYHLNNEHIKNIFMSVKTIPKTDIGHFFGQNWPDVCFKRPNIIRQLPNTS